MPLSIVNWNILYEAERPSDASRFTTDGKPTMAEKKAATAALAYFCYHDNVSASDPNDTVAPADRQLVKQFIKGKEYTYYRGGSNANERMQKVVNNIEKLAGRSDIVCLQEVTPKMAQRLEKTFAATHKIIYSYQPGNHHGVMAIVKNGIEVLGSQETEIHDPGLTRKVRVVDVRDPHTKGIVRIAAAHLYGHHPDQAVDQEASDLMHKLKKLPGKYDTTVIAADVNETKKAREGVATPAVHYANSTQDAGWQLHLLGKEHAVGLVGVQPKFHLFGLCAIMQDQANPSEAMDLSDLPAGLSDHAPIGTKMTVEPSEEPTVEEALQPVAEEIPVEAPSPKPAVKEVPVKPAAAPQQAPQPNVQPPVANPSWYDRVSNFLSNFIGDFGSGLRSIWQWFTSFFS